MKRHYWQYLIDSAGNAVEGAKINVFLANTSQYANIQLSENATSYVTTELTDILTDENGFFHFWVSDDTESLVYGYPVSQKFDIRFSKAGFVSSLIEDVQIIWAGDGKVKINDADENADYLYNKLLEGNNISIATSGEQVVIGFEGIADTYKIKINDEDTTADYLEEKLVAGDNISISPSGEQLVISSNVEGSTDFTYTYNTISISPSASLDLDLENFFNRGLIHNFKLEWASGENSTPYDVEVYSEAAQNNLLYQVISLDPLVTWEDKLVIWYKDLDLTGKLHIKFINYGSLTLGLHMTIKAERFS